MEQGNESDEIVLFAFTQIGCKFDKSIVKLSQLTAEMIIDIVVRSLFLISDGEVKFSAELPSNIASRHRICTSIAGKVKEFGFAGECGYNQLLYPSLVQTKSLLTWLVQKLPKDEDTTDEVLGSNALLNKRVTNELSTWRQAPWTLDMCAKGFPLRNIYNKEVLYIDNNKSFQKVVQNLNSNSHVYTNGYIYPVPTVFELHSTQLCKDMSYQTNIEVESEDVYKSSSKTFKLSESLKNITRTALRSTRKTDVQSFSTQDSTESAFTEQISEYAEKSLPDIIMSINKESSHTEDTSRGTRFTHAAEFGQDSAIISSSITSSSSSLLASSHNDTIITEEEKVQRENIINELKSEVETETAASEHTIRQLVDTTTKIKSFENDLVKYLNISESLENEIMIKKKTLEMLPTAVDNIKKLQSLCASGAARLIQLAQQWETHRIPLIRQIRVINNKKLKRKNLSKLLIEEMKKCREDMIGMVHNLKEKQEKASVLADEMKKLPKNINRQLYTHRILDISASIGKQIQEINKVANDIRGLQKSINQTASSLQRADAIAEDIVYTAANNRTSNDMIDSYRQLRAFRSNFDELINIIGKIGLLERQSRELETKIDQETTRVSTQNIKRILKDIDEVSQNNAELVEQIKSLSRK